jgi:hypothetical protein
MDSYAGGIYNKSTNSPPFYYAESLNEALTGLICSLSSEFLNRHIKELSTN